MIVKYYAFSWTMTAVELKEVLIANVRQMVDRSIVHTERGLKGNPHHDHIMSIIHEVLADLEAGKDSPTDWMEVVSWSFQMQELDSSIGGGAAGKATYYASAGDIEFPAIALGKTSTLIDRPGMHLALDVEVIA